MLPDVYLRQQLPSKSCIHYLVVHHRHIEATQHINKIRTDHGARSDALNSEQNATRPIP